MSNHVLDKGFVAVSTYNGSAVAGVVAKRFVKLTANQTIDLNVASTTRSIGVVMESVDAAKVATGKSVVDVRVLGIARVIAGAILTIGQEVSSSTTGTAIVAASTHYIVGVAMTAAAVGDEIDVLLVQGGIKA
jgi:adenosylmethionine-8-amino-7-oxononanoate aminotransferase